MNVCASSLCAVLVAAGANPALTQTDSPREAVVVDDGIDLARVDGEWRGIAPRYKARFDARGFTFVPRFGSRAQSKCELRFELDSIELAGRPLVLAETGEPWAAGRTLVQPFAAGVEGRCELRPEDLEHSFVFSSLPEPRGELVVRGRLRSTLARAAASDAEGLRYELPGIGAIEYGGVTGLDAAGRTCRGKAELEGQQLTLSLDAEFVAAAELPLVLDPLVGSTLVVSDGNDSGRPDVAYDDSTNRYLVVWERQWSAFDIDILGQRMTAAGAKAGGLVQIETSSAVLSSAPAVGGSNFADRFLVVWQEGSLPFGPWDLRARAVRAADSLLSGIIDVAVGAGSQSAPDVAGNLVAATDGVIVTWQEDGVMARAQRYLVNQGGNPTPLDPGAYILSTLCSEVNHCTGIDHVRVSKAIGGNLRALVVWGRSWIDSFGDIVRALYGAFVPLVGAPEAEIYMGGTWSVGFERPEVDGDGTTFLVSTRYRYGQTDLGMQTTGWVEYPGTFPYLGLSLQPDWTGFASDAAVGLFGAKFGVAWNDQVNPSNVDLRFLESGLNGTALCSPSIPLAATPSLDVAPAIAARRSGGETGTEGLVVYERVPLALPFVGEIVAQRVDVPGPCWSTVQVFPGCFGGGSLSVPGPVYVGNPAHTIALSGADPGATVAILNYSPGGAPLTCGTCVSNPLLNYVVKPCVAGQASHTAPVPLDAALIGAAVEVNWTVLYTATSPCPAFANVANSDTERITIGQ